VKRLLAAAALLLWSSAALGQSLNDRLTGDLSPVHDPVIAREGDRYYLFSTGLGEGRGRLLASRVSDNLTHWTEAGPVFRHLPAWAQRAVPGVKNLWAPDIALVNGRWRLYYSVSTFGSNRSAIGLATSATLNPSSPNYGWRDEGLVLMSTERDSYNAIDPNFIQDRNGRHWLSLGSFWTGLKLFQLDPATGKPADPEARPYAIAQRLAPAGAPAAVEAPFIIDHGGWYWLLASYDYCCKGAASTYYTVVGRSKTINGPYEGRDGSSMLEGGGTVLLRADLPEKQRFRGPGHPGAFRDRQGQWHIVYHAYDRQNKGAPTLRIAPIRWDAEGWPVVDQ
jgi:arabinan endo-1,5-alpha-L-arabinosidase